MYASMKPDDFVNGDFPYKGRKCLLTIDKPRWNGGKPIIGIADFRLKGIDYAEVTIAYTRKDGKRSYPDKYLMKVSDITKYPTQVVGSGVKLYLIPLSDFRVIYSEEGE